MDLPDDNYRGYLRAAMLIVACTGAINQDYLKLIELMNVQVLALRRIPGKRPSCTKIKRAKLVRLADEIDRHVLDLTETIITPATKHGWYKKLIARKYHGSQRRGRSRIDSNTEDLIVKLAKENPGWGENSLADGLKNLCINVDDRTAGSITP